MAEQEELKEAMISQTQSESANEIIRSETELKVSHAEES